jgi:hypothetical protein
MSFKPRNVSTEPDANQSGSTFSRNRVNQQSQIQSIVEKPLFQRGGNNSKQISNNQNNDNPNNRVNHFKPSNVSTDEVLNEKVKTPGFNTETQENKSSGYEKRIGVGVHETRRKDNLPLILERYIDAIADVRKISDEEREKAKQKAAQNPSGYMEKFKAIYLKEVKEIQRQAQDWQHENDPDKIKIMIVKDGSYTIRKWDKSTGHDFLLLDGCTIYQQSISETPFAKNPEIFANLLQKNILIKDNNEAFSDNNDKKVTQKI